ncbi:hypothetical protein [Paracoccus sp. SSK6]|uniref:hypothetical protein n=1 Tax=Paracoccus sp. SSK6 TaxID=3143131 RepID=UPI00321A9ABF
MDDERVWRFEESLWYATDERYHERVDPDCVMALSLGPYIFAGEAAVESVSGTPPWDEVSFADRQVRRPQEGLIVVGYRIAARRGQTQFSAACTSVYRRRTHEDWTVIQHAQIALNSNNRES